MTNDRPSMLGELNRTERHGDGGLRRIDDRNAKRLLQWRAVPRHAGAAHYHSLCTVLVLQHATDLDHPRERRIAGRRLGDTHIDRPFTYHPVHQLHLPEITNMAANRALTDRDNTEASRATMP